MRQGRAPRQPGPVSCQAGRFVDGAGFRVRAGPRSRGLTLSGSHPDRVRHQSRSSGADGGNEGVGHL